jgi:cell fate regulator YaaT (PSP1 superfamily)
MVYDFEAGELPLTHDTRVVVETDRGEALGWTVGGAEVREPHSEGPLRRVVRVATDADLRLDRSHHDFERDALRFCAQRARQLGLPMKVIAVELAHSGEKAAFYFSSEDRIDFRALVKDLAQKFRLRVEMRQVGPRDEAKIIGAMGPCGRETCCSSWLRAFTPVSIKMAKDQGLALNPQKVTGVCGRLLCCLAYEQDTYKELRRKLPKIGKIVSSPQGTAKIIDISVLRGRVRVVLEQGGVAEFDASEVRPLGAQPVIEEPETDEASEEPSPTLETKPAPVSQPKPERREHPPRHERPQQQRPERREQPRQERPPQQRPERREQPRQERSQQPRPEQRREQSRQDRPDNRPPRPPRPEQRPPKPPPPPAAKAEPKPEAPMPSGEEQPSSGEGGQRHRRRRRRGGGGGPKMPSDGGSGSDSE